MPGTVVADTGMGASGSGDDGEKGRAGENWIGTDNRDLTDTEVVRHSTAGFLLFQHYPRTCGASDGEKDDCFVVHAGTGLTVVGPQLIVQYCYEVQSRDDPPAALNVPPEHDDATSTCQWQDYHNESPEY